MPAKKPAQQDATADQKKEQSQAYDDVNHSGG
jgi:hypothetical protein